VPQPHRGVDVLESEGTAARGVAELGCRTGAVVAERFDEVRTYRVGGVLGDGVRCVSGGVLRDDKRRILAPRNDQRWLTQSTV